MANRRQKKRNRASAARDPGRRAVSTVNLDREYHHVCQVAAQRRHEQAGRLYHVLQEKATEPRLKALIANDLGALSALSGDTEAAQRGFEKALRIDRNCEPARANLELLLGCGSQAHPPAAPTPIQIPSPPAPLPEVAREERSAVDGRDGNRIVNVHRSVAVASQTQEPPNGVKVAILSFLFNWPSTGGGIIHTVELAQFLERAGFEVRHFYAQYADWGVGRVETKPPFASEALQFDAESWNAATIQQRFRQAVDTFAPDYVIITDSWNFKPLLAEAVRGYPYFLRLQAMECICPLNNVRLLPLGDGQFGQCLKNQLADPQACAKCVQERGHLSGSLHQAERQLSGVGTSEYAERLSQAFREAEAVLVVNALTEALVAPSSKPVRVVTAGMDPARFPWPWPEENEGGELRAQGGGPSKRRLRIFFAGIVEELLKGFHVLHDACRLLWQRRQDFELVATGDPPGVVDEFTRFAGWLSQEELPRYLRAADILVMPTIAQEALGRTAVEAMAAGRPVVASRLGGLPFTVVEGQTGLLCEPNDPVDLAEKIGILLDDAELRERLGLQGRLRFVREYSWDRIIERRYKPLLRPGVRGKESGVREQVARVASSVITDPCPLISDTCRLSLIVSVLESYEVVRRQLLHLNSVLTPECELILVDDGSEPSLQETCDSVAKDFSFRLLFTTDRRPWTQPKARNLGASVAQADKLVFFDIDHIITPSIIESCLEYRGDKLHWQRRPGILNENGVIVTDANVLQAHGMMDDSPSVHINSFMIRRDLFDLLGGYDERFCGSYGGDDVDFNDRYARLCKLGIVKPDEVSGEGYAYPDPAFDGGRMFHVLKRSGSAREATLRSSPLRRQHESVS